MITNSPSETFTPTQVTNLYRKQMQIEESFRDLKSPLYGFSLRYCRSKWLIAMLAEMLIKLIGLVAQHVGWHRQFQANTVRHRKPLSLIRLGKEVRKRPHYHITEQHLRWALEEFVRLIHRQGNIVDL